MAQSDGFVRITLRIPEGLHARLTEATERKRSMNAEIISALEIMYPPAPDEEELLRQIEGVRTMARSGSEDWTAYLKEALDELESALRAKELPTGERRKRK